MSIKNPQFALGILYLTRKGASRTLPDNYGRLTTRKAENQPDGVYSCLINTPSIYYVDRKSTPFLREIC